MAKEPIFVVFCFCSVLRFDDFTSRKGGLALVGFVLELLCALTSLVLTCIRCAVLGGLAVYIFS